MGNEVSSGESGQRPECGFQVLKVAAGGPCAGKLAPFFDFLVGAGQHALEEEDDTLTQALLEHKGKPMPLLVFNSRTEETRQELVTPAEGWGGDGLLGVSIRFASTDAAHQVWHVLETEAGGPAAEAGLVGGTDYVVGTPEVVLSDREDFFTVVSMSVDKELPLDVFSTLSDSIRRVVLKPNASWGGEGLIGADVGYGYLHRIPSVSKELNPAKAKLQEQKLKMQQLQKKTEQVVEARTPTKLQEQQQRMKQLAEQVKVGEEEKPKEEEQAAPAVAAEAKQQDRAQVEVEEPVGPAPPATPPVAVAAAMSDYDDDLSPPVTPHHSTTKSAAAAQPSVKAPDTPSTPSSIDERKKKLADLQSKLAKFKTRGGDGGEKKE